MGEARTDMNPITRISAAVLVGMALYGASGVSHGLGFGRPANRAVLGERLNLAVPVRLESGEELSSSCVAVDVYFGEDKVSASDIQMQLLANGSMGRIVKITSSRTVYEPVVTVYVVAGCQTKVTRKFVTFADPPDLSQSAAGGAAAAPEPNLPRADVAPGVGFVGGQIVGTGNYSATGADAGGTHVAAPASGIGGKVASSQKVPRRRGAALPAPVAASQTAAPSVDMKVDGSARKSGQPGVDVAHAASARHERLQLDPVDADATNIPALKMSMGMLAQPAGDDPASDIQAKRAAAAALWQALNSTPEQLARDRQRIQELEQRLASLQRESEKARRAVAGMQARVADADAGQRSPILFYATALVSLILGGGLATLVMSWRGKQKARKDELAWLSAQSSVLPEVKAADAESETLLERTSAGFKSVEPVAVKPVTVAAPQPAKAASGPVMSPAPARGPAPTFTMDQPQSGGVPGGSGAATPMTRTGARAVNPNEPLRAVSVEELIDLEQQAEFFIVLGQDEAAIDLLEGHVHSTTGASPLPFLKLLETYQRLGRKEDYERVQGEFNARFNGYAPSWDADLNQGHSLEDYPGIVERVQELWATPARAMGVLERSLTRSDEDVETFDLPAYRELLLLYSVARDLSERDTESRQAVDLRPRFPGHEDGASDVDDSLEPLMATRPVKAVPHAQPSLSVDLSLDDLEPLNDPESMPHAVQQDNHIEFEHIDIAKPGKAL